MSTSEKLKHEFKAILLAMLYFGAWIVTLLVLKELLLKEYHIAFHGFSKALVGALILSKVVLILEHVPLGAWLRDKPVLFDVALRTLLYAVGTFVVMLLEKGFEARHEQGGFVPALMNIFQHPDMPHIWANAICLTAALLVYNLLSALNRHLGTGGLARVFLTPQENAPTD
jgi:hypothetical protein